MKSYKIWNGNNWETCKSTKEAYKKLRERFNNLINEGRNQEAKDMDGEQIHICTEDDEYSYAQIEIIKGDFTIKKI